MSMPGCIKETVRDGQSRSWTATASRDSAMIASAGSAVAKRQASEEVRDSPPDTQSRNAFTLRSPRGVQMRLVHVRIDSINPAWNHCPAQRSRSVNKTLRLSESSGVDSGHSNVRRPEALNQGTGLQRDHPRLDVKRR